MSSNKQNETKCIEKKTLFHDQTSEKANFVETHLQSPSKSPGNKDSRKLLSNQYDHAERQLNSGQLMETDFPEESVPSRHLQVADLDNSSRTQTSEVSSPSQTVGFSLDWSSWSYITGAFKRQEHSNGNSPSSFKNDSNKAPSPSSTTSEFKGYTTIYGYEEYVEDSDVDIDDYDDEDALDRSDLKPDIPFNKSKRRSVAVKPKLATIAEKLEEPSDMLQSYSSELKSTKTKVAKISRYDAEP